MYHSITIGEKNTWDDWHLIPRSRPYVYPPTAKTNENKAYGQDGTLDEIGYLTDSVPLKNRTGSWEMIAENGFMEWHVLYSEIMNYLHGQKHICILEDDPEHYFEGYFTVGSMDRGENFTTISIGYDLAPVKMAINGT